MWWYYGLKGKRVMYVLDPWLMMAGYYDLDSQTPGFARMGEMLDKK